MESMNEWCKGGEYDLWRLTHILDIVQDLKSLSNLLKGGSMNTWTQMTG